ncbi:hypothetical protein CkaCkLH20_11236 [Colletotrichum karsti]|uniref:Major facilitator superfamily (MFS) profile domain-containing protein n=1 Tax=Colletotrichum karsti TaxID=1095194 RepID=A0A9P6I3L2_9PEZI|nr:uncharacterized protein CkaCkLH20_11236 [Colletotrichum karsti]KAF9871315.1 hypothetical protein CkaCkLH20_11236 [Colletotrichum karsti]
MFAFLSPLSSSIAAPALGPIGHDLHINSEIELQLVLSIFLLTYAFGPFILSPCSEIWGRTPIVRVGNIIFILFTTLCGFATSKGQIIAFRFMAGIGGSATTGMGSGVLTDCWRPEERGKGLAMMQLAPVIGPAVGPIVGGYISQYASWRWAFWTVVLVNVFVQIIAFFQLRETYAPRLLVLKARKLRQSTGDPSYQAATELQQKTLASVLRISLSRPWIMLGTQPIIQSLALLQAFNFGLLYLVISSFPTLWEKHYGLEKGRASLNYISIATGSLVGVLICAPSMDIVYRRLKHRFGLGKDQPGIPEFRIPLMIPCSLVTPLGILLFAWSAQQKMYFLIPNVLVIGCGVAGPVVACLLKQKGYEPIIFEKSEAPGDVGASLMICPNGLKVLNLIGPLPDKLLQNGPPVLELCDYKASGEVLGRSDMPNEFAKRYSQPAVGIKRTLITAWLRELAQEKGIEVREGWKLEQIKENENSVTAFFEGDKYEVGSFLVGCDGLKAATRKILLARGGIEEGVPSFTGLTQTAGISPTPEAFRKSPSLSNWYGELSHVICYPITHDKSSWALTLPGNEVEEASWGLFDDERRAVEKEKMNEILNLKTWDPVVLELVSSAQRLMKYGIYDRPELSADQWYSGRCVMVGDAVHPTSVHLGQGANQACEDCYYLFEKMPNFETTSALSNSILTEAFKSYAAKQQPHTSTLVKGARMIGQARVAAPEFCSQRDETISKSMADRAALQEKFDFMYSRPF